MSDSTGNKTEPPSQNKLRRAREEGQVAYSSDLASAAVLAASAVTIAVAGLGAGRDAVRVTAACVAQAVRPGVSASAALDAAGEAAWALTLLSLPLLGAAVVAGVAASFLQVGPLLTFKPLVPKADALNPVKGLKGLIFSKKAMVTFGMTLLKFVVAGIVGTAMLWGARGPLVRLALVEPAAGGHWVFDFSISVCAAVIGAIGVLAVGDVLYQRWQFMQDQMMTKEEAKRDFKQDEGDPEHKAKRRAMQEEIAFGIMLQEVPDADVVITNPDHVAVALRWDGAESGAPKLVAKGRGQQAQKIKEAAARAGVPIRRQEALARSLVTLKAFAQIPGPLYEAVAAILEWAEEEAQASGRVPNWRKREDEASGDEV